MTKLNVAILAGNCENTIDLCIKSVIDVADKIIVIYDTTSKDETYEKIVNPFNFKIKVIKRQYDHNYNVKSANSDARNFYLDYLKKNHLGEWCLVLDADEFCDEGINLLKEQLDKMEIKENEDILLSPKMIHFIQDLGHEDATKDKHYVLNRLFRITNTLQYPTGEHPVLSTTTPQIQAGTIDFFTIYHLAYAKEMFYIKERYLNHLNKSEMHSEDYLQNWYYQHLFGYYPKKELNPVKLPKILKDEFKIDDDFFYFQNRKLEMKHLIDASDWKEYFKPNTALCIGDGIGVRTHALRRYGVNAKGFDISEYAVKHSTLHREIYWLGDAIINKSYGEYRYDLIVLYDILEHLTEEQLDMTLHNVYEFSKRDIIISVPVIGDPNLLNDDTHKIFWTKEQWINKIESHGFKVKETPSHFLFKEQLIIAEKQ